MVFGKIIRQPNVGARLIAPGGGADGQRGHDQSRPGVGQMGNAGVINRAGVGQMGNAGVINRAPTGMAV